MTTNKTIQGLVQTNKGPVKIAGGAGIHIGTEAPTNGETVWIDTDEETENDSTQIDVIAQPGQIIAVKEVDANGKPTKWEAIDLPKAKEPETPDFSANEGEPGYIENRTHYVDKKGVIHKLPNMYIDAEWMATKEDGGAGKTVFIPEQTVTGIEDVGGNTIQTALVAGNVYAVEVNGVLYRCECYSYDGLICLGNGTLIGGTGGNNEPFCVTWTGGAVKRFLFYNDDTLESPIGIKVSDWLDEVYNKLPEEFLPPVSWNNLTDKPFVEGAGELLFTQTVTFDTDAAATSGKKVSSSGLSLVGGAEYWLDVNGDLFKCRCEKTGTGVYIYSIYDSNDYRWIRNLTNAIYVYGQSAGTYTYRLYTVSDDLMLDPQYIPPNLAKKSDIPQSTGGGTSIDVTAEVGQTIVVKEIDENGKPTKWESADYQPRTHWEEEAVLLSGTFDAPTLQRGVAVDFALTVGNTYTVVWNGVEYSCPVRYLPSDEGVNFPVLGNVDLALEAGDTGEPFLLVYMDRILVDLSVSEYTTVELSIKGNKVNAIPQRYLANCYPYYIDVIRETFSDVQTPDMYTCSDTVENIKTIFESGRDIKIRVKSTGDNVIPYVLIYDLYLYDQFISGFFGFVSFPLSSSGFRNLLFLNPQEDGTYSVTDSIGD